MRELGNWSTDQRKKKGSTTKGKREKRALEVDAGNRRNPACRALSERLAEGEENSGRREGRREGGKE